MSDLKAEKCPEKRYGLLIGGAMMIILASAVAKKLGFVDGDLIKRVVGVMFGVILLIAGNALPKIITPLSERATPARSLDRFAGTSFVLAGFFCIAACIFAPGDWALTLASMIAVSAFVVVGFYWAWRRGADASHSRPKL